MHRRFLIVFIMAAGLQGQIPKLFWDGSDWQKMGTLTREYPEFALPIKKAYVAGLLDSKYYYFLQAQALDSAQAAILFRDYLSAFSLDEMVRGTDEFYRDPANGYLPVLSALAIVSLGALAFPDSVIADFTAASREWINRLTQMYSHEVPIILEGIDRPRAPRPPVGKYPRDRDRPHRWYFPDSLVLP